MPMPDGESINPIAGQLKRCSLCKESLPVSSFGLCSAKPDKLQAYCRPCYTIKSKARWVRTFEHQSNQRKAWRAKNKQKVVAYADKQTKKDRLKVRVRQAVQRKIRRGEIERLPCSVCGDPNSQAHHEDYSKPFDIVFLCPKHHSERHAEINSLNEYKQGTKV